MSAKATPNDNGEIHVMLSEHHLYRMSEHLLSRVFTHSMHRVCDYFITIYLECVMFQGVSDLSLMS